MYIPEYQIFLRKDIRVCRRNTGYFSRQTHGTLSEKLRQSRDSFVSNLNEFVYQIHLAKLVTSRESFSFAKKCGASNISFLAVRFELTNIHDCSYTYLVVFGKHSKSFSLCRIIRTKISSDNMSRVPSILMDPKFCDIFIWECRKMQKWINV